MFSAKSRKPYHFLIQNMLCVVLCKLHSDLCRVYLQQSLLYSPPATGFTVLVIFENSLMGLNKPDLMFYPLSVSHQVGMSQVLAK